jgi:hypothetical protein
VDFDRRVGALPARPDFPLRDLSESWTLQLRRSGDSRLEAIYRIADRFPGGTRESSPKSYHHSLLDNGRLLYLFNGGRSPRLTVFDGPEAQSEAAKMLSAIYEGNWKSGLDDLYFDEILSLHVDVVRLLPARETINGHSCMALEAKTPFGQYQLWIDPENGYQIRRAVVRKSAEDLSWMNRPFGYKPPKPKELEHFVVPVRKEGLFTLDQVELADLGYGRFFLSSALASSVIRHEDGSAMTNTSRIRVRDLVLNPDFAAMGAFNTDFIPEGAITTLTVAPYLTYEWRDGNVVPRVDREQLKQMDKILDDGLLQPEVAGVPSNASQRASTLAGGRPDRPLSGRIALAAVVAFILSVILATAALIASRRAASPGAGRSGGPAT